MGKCRGGEEDSPGFYMKQSGTLDNACGLIALIHSILNNPQIELAEGSPLAQFIAANQDATPQQICESLEGFEPIQQLHCAAAGEGSVAGKRAAEGDEVEGHKKGVNHHFVAYVLDAKKRLIELDGTKEGPWVVAEGVEPDGLVAAVGTEMIRRVNDGEI